MTIGTSTSRVSFACDGVTKIFPVPIQAYLATDFTVILTAPVSAGGGEATLVLNSDYSLATSGTLAPTAWTLTTLATNAYATGYTLQAIATPVQTQQTQYVQGQAFPSLAVQTNIDRLTQMVQRLQDQVNRAIRVPDGDVSPLMLLPVTASRLVKSLMMDASGNITLGVPNTQTITSALLAPFLGLSQTAQEAAAGVTPTNLAYRPGDIRRYGAVADAIVNGTGGTDNSAAIATALSCAGQAVYVPYGNWGFKNIVVPQGSCFVGEGVEKSNFIALSGATGTMLADNGSAAKTIIRKFSFFCNGPSAGNNTSYTAGFVLGKTIAFGTEGYLDQIEVRDLPSSNAAGFPGIDITGNVGEIGALYALNTGGVQIIGTGNMAQYIESTASRGWLLPSGQVACLNLQDCYVAAWHIEAPGAYTTGGTGGTPNFSGSTTVPLVLGGGGGSPSGNVCGPGSISLSANAGGITWTYDHLIELGAGVSVWQIPNVKVYYNGAAGFQAAVTGGLIKDSSGNYSGGSSPTTTGSHGMDNNYASGAYLTGRSFAIQSSLVQGFTIRIATIASVIKHQIGQIGSPTAAGNFAGQINAATATQNTTPTGADASTPFAFGAKVGSASPSLIILDTNDQGTLSPLVFATLSANSSGTDYNIVAAFLSHNVNGVTRTRLCLSLTNKITAAAVNWSTALGANTLIDVTVLGFLK